MSKLDKFLYLYSTGFVILIVLSSALNPDKGPSTLMLGAIFTPVAIFLIFSFIHYLKNKPEKKAKETAKSPLQHILTEQETQINQEFAQQLSLTSSFFSQKHPLFLITIGLLSIAFAATVVKSAIGLTQSDTQTNSQPISYQLESP